MSAADERRVKSQLLHRAYEGNKSSHVAFIDESYLAPARGEAQEPFYLATAYLAPVEDHGAIRTDIQKIVGGNFWHTTQSHQREEERPTIHRLCEYVGDGGDQEFSVIAVKVPVDASDADAEQARSECLTALLGALFRGTHGPGISLAVYEERKFQSQRAADLATIKAAVSSGAIGRNMRLFAASPSYEALLWLPDVVSFAAYHRQIESGHSYMDACAHKVTYLSV